MALVVKCPGCKTTLMISNDQAGSSITCPRCDLTMSVPTTPTASHSVPTTPTASRQIVFACPNPACRKRYKVSEDQAGKAVTCVNPACGMQIQIPYPVPKPDTAHANLPNNEPGAVFRDWRSDEAQTNTRTNTSWDSFEDEEDYGRRVKPHRSALILVLGILSLILCAPLGIAAWIMGKSDLTEMRWGRMDRSGEGATFAGYVMGIISTVIFALVFVASCMVGMMIAVVAGR